MTKLREFKRHLRPGRVYRREDLARWSTSVDRHLKQLVEGGVLKKLSGGLYAYPRKTVFGEAPAKDSEVVGAFLKDDRFLLASPNAYNSLGVGTTQLYDKTVERDTSADDIPYYRSAGSGYGTTALPSR